MEISNKLKNTIFKKLYKELSNVEIIPCELPNHDWSADFSVDEVLIDGKVL